MPTPRGRYLGRIKDVADPHDKYFGMATPTVVPPYQDLRPYLPPAFNQGQMNSCGANAADALLCYWYNRSAFSRLQLYYDVRVLEGNQTTDAGVMLRDVMKVLKDPGGVVEGVWPYDPAKLFDPPPDFPVSDERFKITQYMRLQDQNAMIASLAAGVPFILGFDVYDSFDGDQVAKTGIMSYPKPSESLLGGHAVLVVGYDTAFHYNADLEKSGLDTEPMYAQALLCRNSWGTEWGLKGHFWMPLDYPDDTSDVWAATIGEPNGG